MTTTTSFSEKIRFWPLYKMTLRQNGGYLALLSALIVVFYPLQYALEVFKKLGPYILDTTADLSSNPYYYYDLYGIGKNFTIVSAIFFTMIMLLVPIWLGLMLNSYMHSKKAADVYHALPIRRETLLGVNAAVAMTILAVPVVLSNLVVAVLSIAKFGVRADVLGYQLLDMVSWMACAFLIYTVVTFVSVHAGTVFDSFFFSGVALFLLFALGGTAMLLTSSFLYGYRPNMDAVQILLLLCPVLFIFMRFVFSSGYDAYSPHVNMDDDLHRFFIQSNVTIFIYLAVAAVLLFLTMKLYVRRRSELAETTNSRGILQIVTKAAAAVFCSVYTGLLFYAINDMNAKSVFVIWALIGGLLGYAITEVILSRGFKTLLKSLPLGGAMVAATVILTLSVMYGGFGYETRVPSVEKIAYVELSGHGNDYQIMSLGPVKGGDTLTGYDRQVAYQRQVTLKDPANIEAVTQYHRSIVEKRFDKNESDLIDAGEAGCFVDSIITYHFKNGGKMTRKYNYMSTKSLELLLPLETNEEYLAQRKPAFFMQPEDITKWHLTNAFGGSGTEYILTKDENTQLLQAMQADYKAMKLEDLMAPQTTVLAVLTYETKEPLEARALFSDSASFIVTDQTKQTYQFLKTKGMLESVSVNLSNCIAVSTKLVNIVRSGLSEGMPIVKIDGDGYTFTYDELEQKRERIREYEEECANDDAYSDGDVHYYQDEYLFENPEEIRALAECVVPSWNKQEPYLIASFYFRGEQSGRKVIIPISKLPAELHEKLMY